VQLVKEHTVGKYKREKGKASRKGVAAGGPVIRARPFGKKSPEGLHFREKTKRPGDEEKRGKRIRGACEQRKRKETERSMKWLERFHR